ncbi:MAG: tRNA (guanosine(46)-N7)-methyltransferase TrmB [Deltaproteobacteria bacterium]|nr:tRNA (guanosine(46)-N7)-methyltransferase TrmB [Deltaproteobacteria bacterium]
MSRALKHDIPGADRRIGEGDVRAKGWAAIFGDDADAARPLVVEIGFGRGEFLIDLALAAPATPHVGVEYSTKRVLKMARRLARAAVANVRLLDCTGEIVVHDLLAPASVQEFWINFPDPWPKKRHHRRRLLQPEMVRALAERLVASGSLHVATDHEGYADAIDAALAGEPLLENAFAPAPFLRDVPGRRATAYEVEWRAEGRPMHFWHYRRCAA